MTTDDSDDRLRDQWRDITTAAARVQRLLDADLEAAGINPQWYPVLDELLRADDHRLPMSALARAVSMTSGGFSKLADRMAADGMIDRRGTTDDRRVVHAALTPQGREIAERARRICVVALRTRLPATRPADALAAAATILGDLAAVVDPGEFEVPEQVADDRDPALPERRGRGRGSGSASL